MEFTRHAGQRRDIRSLNTSLLARLAQKWLGKRANIGCIGQAVGIGHIEWPGQFPQGKVSIERLSKGSTTGCIGQAVGVSHIGWPSQPAQGRLSTEWLGKGPSTDGIGQALGRQWE